MVMGTVLCGFEGKLGIFRIYTLYTTYPLGWKQKETDYGKGDYTTIYTTWPLVVVKSCRVTGGNLIGKVCREWGNG